MTAVLRGVTNSKAAVVENDAFFTKPDVAKFCVDTLDLKVFNLVVEPSAGDGAFLPFLPSSCLALDINPNHPRIVKLDFLEVTSRFSPGTLVIGNPPFGYRAALAIKFINHAFALGAACVAFILPRSILKDTVFKGVSETVHVRSVVQLPSASFLAAGVPYSVPCVWMVLEDLKFPREKLLRSRSGLPAGFTRVNEAAGADIWVRRVGGAVGESGVNPTKFSINSNYFIKIPDYLCPAEFSSVVSSIPVPATAKNTVGPWSLTVEDLSARLSAAVNML